MEGIENVNLATKAASVENEIRLIDIRIHHLEEEIRQQEIILGCRHEELKAVNVDNLRLQQLDGESEGRVKNLEKNVERCNEMVSGIVCLVDLMNKMKEKIDEQTAARQEDYDVTVAVYEKEEAVASAQLLEAEAELKNVKEQQDKEEMRFRDQIIAISDELGSGEREKDSISAEISKLDARESELVLFMDKMDQSLKTARSTNEERESEIAVFQCQVDKLENDNKSISATKSGINQQICQVKDEVQAIGGDMQNIDEETQQLEMNANKLEMEVEVVQSLQGNLLALKEKDVALTEQLDKSEKDLLELRDVHAQRLAALEAKSELDVALKTAQEEESKLSETTEKVTVLRSEVNRLSDIGEDLDAKKSRMQAKLKELAKEEASLRFKVENEKQEENLLKSQVEDCERNFNEQKVILNQVRDELLEVDKLRRTLEEQKTRIKSMEAEKVKERQLVGDMERAFKEEVGRLREELEREEIHLSSVQETLNRELEEKRASNEKELKAAKERSDERIELAAAKAINEKTSERCESTDASASDKEARSPAAAPMTANERRVSFANCVSPLQESKRQKSEKRLPKSILMKKSGIANGGQRSRRTLNVPPFKAKAKVRPKRTEAVKDVFGFTSSESESGSDLFSFKESYPRSGPSSSSKLTPGGSYKIFGSRNRAFSPGTRFDGDDL